MQELESLKQTLNSLNLQHQEMNNAISNEAANLFHAWSKKKQRRMLETRMFVLQGERIRNAEMLNNLASRLSALEKRAAESMTESMTESLVLPASAVGDNK